MSGLKFSKEHTWAAVDGDVASVGITDYAQKELGDVVFIELPAEGDSVTKSNSFGTIESVKAVSDLHAPLSGTVTEVNELLDDEPETVNASPYGDGWILKMKLSDASELDSMLSEDDYNAFIEKK